VDVAQQPKAKPQVPQPGSAPEAAKASAPEAAKASGQKINFKHFG
jgi:hypothetical protein